MTVTVETSLSIKQAEAEWQRFDERDRSKGWIGFSIRNNPNGNRASRLIATYTYRDAAAAMEYEHESD
jgi:hypothetical protein